MSRFLILELDGVLPDCDPERVQLEVIDTTWAKTTLFATCGIDSVPVLAIWPVLPGGATERQIDTSLNFIKEQQAIHDRTLLNTLLDPEDAYGEDE